MKLIVGFNCGRDKIIALLTPLLNATAVSLECAKGHFNYLCFEDGRRLSMKNVKNTFLAFFTIALLLGATRATLAQSAYTTGTADSDAAAGYPTSFGGAVIYDYLPSYGQHDYVPSYGRVDAVPPNWGRR
jgi:hypothetical protein